MPNRRFPDLRISASLHSKLTRHLLQSAAPDLRNYANKHWLISFTRNEGQGISHERALA